MTLADGIQGPYGMLTQDQNLSSLSSRSLELCHPVLPFMASICQVSFPLTGAPGECPSPCVLALKHLGSRLPPLSSRQSPHLFLLPDAMQAPLPSPGALVWWSQCGVHPTFLRRDFCNHNTPLDSQLLHLGAGASPLRISTLLTSLCVASFFHTPV